MYTYSGEYTKCILTLTSIKKNHFYYVIVILQIHQFNINLKLKQDPDAATWLRGYDKYRRSQRSSTKSVVFRRLQVSMVSIEVRYVM